MTHKEEYKVYFCLHLGQYLHKIRATLQYYCHYSMDKENTYIRTRVSGVYKRNEILLCNKLKLTQK